MLELNPWYYLSTASAWTSNLAVLRPADPAGLLGGLRNSDLLSLDSVSARVLLTPLMWDATKFMLNLAVRNAR